MRGVDGRGGGFSGDRGNPPPAGGRGRGMVLPAWLVAQQNAQMGGPVSFFFFFFFLPPGARRPARPVRWLGETEPSKKMLQRYRMSGGKFVSVAVHIR